MNEQNGIKRKLATIEKILDIQPIKNADKIEVATVRGWKVVVKKNEFKVGDWCIYIEIDSVLPPKPEFEFLANSKYRIKTRKMRNQISQGIVFPLSILPHKMPFLSEGTDVTDILQITKYEPPIPAQLSGISKGSFPSHSVKTDEERIQNLVENYEELKKETYIETEKLDGCLDGDTLIETIDGIKTIKEICETKYSGKVKTFNLETQKEEFRKILGHSIKEPTTHQWFEIILKNNTKIKITGNHKVWLPELLCWRRVDELDGNEEFLLKK